MNKQNDGRFEFPIAFCLNFISTLGIQSSKGTKLGIFSAHLFSNPRESNLVKLKFQANLHLKGNFRTNPGIAFQEVRTCFLIEIKPHLQNLGMNLLANSVL